MAQKKIFLPKVLRFNRWFSGSHRPRLGALDFIKYIGPGFLVTIGFIDPGNWAADLAAGSSFGYAVLWVVTLSTVMLIVLQHNAAHLGIVTGECLSESAHAHLSARVSQPLLATAVIATVSTAFAEILGAAIALNLLTGLGIKAGAILATVFVGWMLYSHSYRRIERVIIGFVSLIGISFIFELSLVQIHWQEAALAWVVPQIPHGSIAVIMSVLGAVVMPHNLFLHSEIIQSRQCNLQDKNAVACSLRYEFLDTLISMIVGWAINSAIILLAVATFFAHGIPVVDLSQAQHILKPLLGNSAAIIFALALLLAGISACVTAGMAGGTIIAGMMGESYDVSDWHTRLGVGITLVAGLAAVFFVTNTFNALVVSQIILSIQLPFTIFMQLYLTSSKKVMGAYVNKPGSQIFLWCIGIIVVVLNVMLLKSFLR